MLPINLTTYGHHCNKKCFIKNLLLIATLIFCICYRNKCICFLKKTYFITLVLPTERLHWNYGYCKVSF